MAELKQLCKAFGIPLSKGKGPMIEAILYFVDTGTAHAIKELPAHLRAQKGKIYPLHENTPIYMALIKMMRKHVHFLKS